ncbi:hypothetical protein ABIA33_004696 [Streptacidiphilus sp. MAP12-16]|uniref:hypothetical protein n=1 Tax=Streptacidiphilus sp. MAP12-16 TaxID=3156300 RepID=UPI00351295DA
MSPSIIALDHTALAALGSGHRFLSHVVDQAHANPDRRVLIATACLAQAEQDRPGSAEHFGALPALAFIDLDFAAACTIGSLAARGHSWAVAHAAHLARPSVDWPHGLPLLTAVPDAYRDLGVRAFPIDPPS